jgi:hypothetical protein
MSCDRRTGRAGDSQVVTGNAVQQFVDQLVNHDHRSAGRLRRRRLRRAHHGTPYMIYASREGRVTANLPISSARPPPTSCSRRRGVHHGCRSRRLGPPADSGPGRLAAIDSAVISSASATVPSLTCAFSARAGPTHGPGGYGLAEAEGRAGERRPVAYGVVGGGSLVGPARPRRPGRRSPRCSGRWSSRRSGRHRRAWPGVWSRWGRTGPRPARRCFPGSGRMRLSILLT